MQITTNTLKRFNRAFVALLFVCALTPLAACDRVANVVSQIGSDHRAETAVAFQGRVVGISDGDTITVLDEQNKERKIRLSEIDAPERGQPWGDRSKQALSALVFGKSVSVQQTDTDRYGRVVARVFADGDDINRAMVRDGHAWAYREYLTDQTLIATEARARQSRSGLWSMSDAETVPPWQWRRGARVTQSEPVYEGHPSTPLRSLLEPGSKPQMAIPTETFTCGSKRFCREMSSCAEAQFYLRQCSLDTIDGNDDGEPCEVLCGTARQ